MIECPDASEALVASVLARIGQLLPELAGDVAESAHRHGVRTARSAARWWAPHDIARPPSAELVVAPAAYGPADVRRVLRDL